MLECNVILTIFAHYICSHGYIHFIYLFNPNTKYRDILLILPSPTLKKRAFGNILLDAPSCCLRREAKSFFPLTEYMPFKCEYNSNFDHILIKFSFSANLTALVSTLQWEWITLFCHYDWELELGLPKNTIPVNCILLNIILIKQTWKRNIYIYIYIYIKQHNCFQHCW